MTFHRHATEFAGLPVVEYRPGRPLPTVDGPVAWRYSFWDFDDHDRFSDGFRDGFEAFVDELGPRVEALVVGAWGYAAFNPAPIPQLCRVAPRLHRLKALFLGDMTSEECEVSWMKVGDVSLLLDAYPDLEVLRVRGCGEELEFRPVTHARLRSLAFESGGLSREVVGAVLRSRLPALTDLELWLGVDDYGGDVTVDDLAPLLAGAGFRGLRSLGLRNAEHADRLAGALAVAPVVQRLTRLDLSLGTLGDSGAQVLLAGQSLDHLDELDLHHHYLTEATAARLVRALPGVRVDVSDRQEPEQYDGDEYRYPAVTE
jgi:hypothetical protein